MGGDKWMAGKRFVVELHNYLLSEHPLKFLVQTFTFLNQFRDKASFIFLSDPSAILALPCHLITFANDFGGRFQLKKWKLLMLMLLLLTAVWQHGSRWHLIGDSWISAWPQLDNSVTTCWCLRNILGQLKYSFIMQWLNDSFLSTGWQLCYSWMAALW